MSDLNEEEGIIRKKIVSAILSGSLFFVPPMLDANMTDETKVSFHAGGMHPNGVDLMGYSFEDRISETVYSFYNFGFPSFAAIGINYYQKYQGDGITGTVGVGIGSVSYASLAYQWKTGARDYLKLGAGFTAGVAYSGAFPVLSYEHRF